MAKITPDAPEYDGFIRALNKLELQPAILTADEANALEAELNTYEPMTVDELLSRSGLEAQTAPAKKLHRYRLAAAGAARDAWVE